MLPLLNEEFKLSDFTESAGFVEGYLEDLARGKKNQNDLVTKINKLDEVSKKLSKKGKTPTLKELSEAMNLPEDEVQSLIDEMMKALEVIEEEDEE